MPVVTIYGVGLKQQHNGSYSLRCSYQYEDEKMWRVYEEIISENEGNRLKTLTPLAVSQYVTTRIP
jgi:hypothetical protein